MSRNDGPDYDPLPAINMEHASRREMSETDSESVRFPRREIIPETRSASLMMLHGSR